MLENTRLATSTHDFLRRYFQETYVPKTTQVFLTVTNKDTTTTTTSVSRYKICPISLAMISKLFRDIPTPPDGQGMELNRLDQLHTCSDVACFIALCGLGNSLIIGVEKQSEVTSDWIPAALDVEDDKAKFNFHNFVSASRLCDYLGIDGVSIISSMQYGYLMTNTLDQDEEIAEKLIFHQIAIQTNNQSATRDIELYLCKVSDHEEAEHEEDDDGDGTWPVGTHPDIIHNYTMRAVHNLYHHISTIIENFDDIRNSVNFLIKELGWNEELNVHYGYRISLHNRVTN